MSLLARRNSTIRASSHRFREQSRYVTLAVSKIESRTTLLRVVIGAMFWCRTRFSGSESAGDLPLIQHCTVAVRNSSIPLPLCRVSLQMRVAHSSQDLRCVAARDGFLRVLAAFFRICHGTGNLHTAAVLVRNSLHSAPAGRYLRFGFRRPRSLESLAKLSTIPTLFETPAIHDQMRLPNCCGGISWTRTKDFRLIRPTL